MVPIELDDQVPQPEPSARPRLGRRARRRLAVAAAAVVLTLVAAQWTADLRERASWNQLSDRTGVVPPVGRSVRALWSFDASLYGTLSHGVPWRGTVVGPEVAPDGSIGIVEIDDRDGRRRWTRTVVGPDAARAARGADLVPSASCGRVPDDASRVVCLVTDVVATNLARSADTAQASEVHLVVIDPRDGRVAADHRLGTDLSMLGPVLRGGLVVMASWTAGRPEIAGVDVASGRERWRTATASARQDGLRFDLMPVGDEVAALGGPGFDLISRDGAIRRSGALSDYVGAIPLADGRLAVLDGGGTLVVGPDRDVRLEGVLAGIVSDDGSLPGLTLVRSGTLRAYDAEGRQRWELQGSSPSAVLVLRGVLYVTRDGEVAALDGSTGAVRWHTALPVQPRAPVTDGRVLLAALSTEVVALDLRTGAVLSRSPLPSGRTELATVCGLLVTSARDGSGTDVLG